MSEEYLELEKEFDDLLWDGKPVTLKNPGTDYFADFLRISGEIGKLQAQGVKGEELFGNLSESTLNSLQKLVNGTLEKSFPEQWKKDKDSVKQWGLENGMMIMFKVLDMCTPKGRNSKDRVEKIKERINADRQQQ